VVLFVPHFVLHILLVNFSWIVSASRCRHILPNHLNLGVLWLCCFFYSAFSISLLILEFRICHNKGGGARGSGGRAGVGGRDVELRVEERVARDCEGVLPAGFANHRRWFRKRWSF
jgi:hypothetical protein